MTTMPEFNRETLGRIELGRATRGLWSLAADATFLNHGSYGAVPLVVQAEQARLRMQLEAHPDAFMARIYPTAVNSAVRPVAAQIAAQPTPCDSPSKHAAGKPAPRPCACTFRYPPMRIKSRSAFSMRPVLR
jgi:hypothetical protein